MTIMKAELYPGHHDHEQIAIVGAGCRYPGGVTDTDSLWTLVRDRKDGVSDIPADRWDVGRHLDTKSDQPGKMYTGRGGFIPNIDMFDADFFGITPREAETIDPQQRLLLETAYEALENAAIAPDSLAGTMASVFVGAPSPDFGHRLQELPLHASTIYQINGTGFHAAAGRLSYTFGLTGPSVSIDTACSTSLVAVHLACQSLLSGESDLAISGGANILLGPYGAVLFCQGQLLARNGACKTFDADADGFVRSEGCGIVVLKRLSDAQRDGDPIVGIIRGSAVNSDGRSAGLTQPHGPAQEAVVRSALRRAKLQPTDIDYVEAHGTGTPIGDPIEVQALVNVLGDGRSPDRKLVLGSIKTNIGHPEAASGLAGLLKVVMALQHQEIPANLHFRTPNPRLDWDSLPVQVADVPRPWPWQNGRPRRAGVSSFGFSGTNAHVVLEEVPSVAPVPSVDATYLFPLSARTGTALAELAGRHLRHLERHPELRLADIALTLGVGREHQRRRVAFIAETREQLEAGLRAVADGALPASGAQSPERRAVIAPRIAFLFTGQGAQYVGMGRELYDTEPVFRAVIDRAAALLDPLLDQPFCHVLFGLGDATSPINETAYTQPALYALECGLVTLWQSWGITPVAVLGHSVGEYAAAFAAGVFGFEDGLRLVAARGRLMQALPRGGVMLAVSAAEAEVTALVASFADQLAIAGINGPDEIVVSGAAYAAAQLRLELEGAGIPFRPLDVSHAFHSPLLDPMLDEFEAVAATVAYAVPTISLISNVTGQAFPTGTAPSASYWRRHAREAVQFAPAIDALADAGIDLLMELGPAPVLLGLAARNAPAAAWASVACLRRTKAGRGGDVRNVLAAARDLYVCGASLRWAAIRSGGCRVRLPTYPFQRTRHWLLGDPVETAAPRRRGHSILGEHQPSPGNTIAFLSELSTASPSYLAQHVIHGAAILPGAAMLEAMFAAGRAIGLTRICLRQIVFERPLEFDEGRVRLLHTLLTPDEAGEHHLVISSSAADAPVGSQNWVEHARARIGAGIGDGTNSAAPSAILRASAVETLDIAQYYRDSADSGVDLGPAFQVLSQEHRDGLQTVARLQRRTEFDDGIADPLINVHPTILDGIMQVAGSQISEDQRNSAFIPLSIDEIVLFDVAPDVTWATLNVKELATEASSRMLSDLRLETETGTIIATVTGLTSQRVAAGAISNQIVTQSFVQRWEPGLVGTASSASTLDLLILPDRGGVAERLAAAVLAAGGRVCLLSDVAEVVAAARRQPDASILDCRALDPADDLPAPDTAARAYSDVLELVQGLSAEAPMAALCVLTQGAVVAAPGDQPNIAAAALVGLLRTLVIEQIPARRAHLDLESGAAIDPRVLVTALVSMRPEESSVALRHGALLLQRLRPMPAKPDLSNIRTGLDITTRGDFDNLQFVERPRQAPGPNEVEIEVRVAGLNFRDLINALGMYPAPVPPLGSECAGIVTAIGAGIIDLQPGDEVVAIAPDSFGSHCLCPRPLVVRKPEALSFAAAVTIPNAYLTAQLCLDVASVPPGGRVLVHAAAGGVGSALVRLARLAGLEVFATAGSDEKRAFARARGATHVFDSRSTAFAAEIMAVTGGEGVDLVVNSLAGDFIEAGLRIVRPGGAFVEIGKQGLWTEAQAAAVSPGIRYLVEDLGYELQVRPEAFRGRLERLMQQAGEGVIDPLPLQVFPLSEAKAAFRHMAAARHIGKIVLSTAEWPTPAPIRSDGTYLVTGGFGGIGLLVVRWLLENGAGLIIVLSRSGAVGRETLLAELNVDGERVLARACDVGDAEAVALLWSEELCGLPPVRGIFHAAGVLDDAPVERQDASRFEMVRRPKMDGAWNLHLASLREPLDRFVLFSSTAAVLGSPGQANYATANAFLDGLAEHRRARGLPATSIAWGPWAEIGMAAGMQAQQHNWARQGIGLISPQSGIAALDASLSSALPCLVVLAVNLRIAARSDNPSFSRLLGGKQMAARAGDPAARNTQSASLVILKAVRESATGQALADPCANYLADEVGRVLGFNGDSIDRDVTLTEAGLDSLMAVQLRNAILAQLGIDLPVRELLSGNAIPALAASMARTIEAKRGSSAATEPEGETVEEGVI